MRFQGSRSYGYQTLSQQQGIIDLFYLREFLSLQISCMGCNGPLSLALWRPCENFICWELRLLVNRSHCTIKLEAVCVIAFGDMSSCKRRHQLKIAHLGNADVSWVELEC